MLATVEVRAPSRLHFGMFSFGRTDTRQFGGVGVMVDQPGLLLRVSRSDQMIATGPFAVRASNVACRVAEHLQIAPHFQIEVLSAPPAHVGLGSGTQLDMSIAASIYALQGEPQPNVEQLVAASGRAKRSAIGAHGFVHGGLLIESGKWQADELSPLVAHVSLPAGWRFVLLTPRGDAGLHGTAEVMAFERLPPVDPAVSTELQRLAMRELLPTATAGNFLRFRDTLEAFNDLAGACFATVQGGHYAPQAQRVIDELRAQKVRGYAQTSWGPTVCVVCESAAATDDLVRNWREVSHDVDVRVATIAQHGATIQT